MDDIQRKAEAAFEKDPLLYKLVNLEILMDKLEARKD